MYLWFLCIRRCRIYGSQYLGQWAYIEKIDQTETKTDIIWILKKKNENSSMWIQDYRFFRNVVFALLFEN